MFANYRAAFRAPGSVAFSAASFVMRMPIAMYPLGLILLISTRTHHYGFAGVLSAAYILGGAPGNLIGSRLVDRYGQGRILLPVTGVHVLAVAVLVLLAVRHYPQWTLLLPTVVVGFSYLPVGSLVRARWSRAWPEGPELASAYSFESTLDELIFLIGPLVATVIATQVSPVLVMILAGTFVGSGAVLLARLRATEPPPHPVDAPARRSALRYRGMALVVLVAIAMGAIFASAEVTMVAFCGQHGHQSLSGVALAAFALGSGISGLFYGAHTWRRNLLDRFLLHTLIFAVMPFLFLAAFNVASLIVCALLVGLAIAPTLITTFALISRIVPGASLTEGLSWLTTGLNVGYGAAAAIVGHIADAEGARVAFSVTIAAGILMGLFAAALHVRSRRADPAQPAQPAQATLPSAAG